MFKSVIGLPSPPLDVAVNVNEILQSVLITWRPSVEDHARGQMYFRVYIIDTSTNQTISNIKAFTTYYEYHFNSLNSCNLLSSVRFYVTCINNQSSECSDLESHESQLKKISDIQLATRLCQGIITIIVPTFMYDFNVVLIYFTEVLFNVSSYDQAYSWCKLEIDP